MVYYPTKGRTGDEQMRKRLLCAPLMALATTVAVTLAQVDAQAGSGMAAFWRDALAQGGLDALSGAVIWALLTAFYCLPLPCAYRRGDRAKLTLLSLLFSAVLTLGPVYRQGEDALIGFLYPYHLLLMAVKLCGWTPLFWRAMKWLLRRMDKPRAVAAPIADTLRLRRVFLLAWAALLLCWLPMWVARFPAALNNDESRALQMLYGEAAFTDDHPYGYTLTLGAFLWLGRALGGASLGAALFAWAQAVFLSGALAYTVRELARLGTPRWARLCACALYALCPLTAHFGFIVLKDILYSAAFVGYVITLCRALEEPEGCWRRRSWAASWVAFSLMLLLWRHNGKMVVYPTSLALLLLCWRGAGVQKRALRAGLLAAPIAAAALFGALAVSPNAIHVDNGANVMGVSLQQVARVVCYDSEGVSASEREAIDRVADFERVGAEYSLRTSDPARRAYRYFDPPTLRDWAAYTKAWLAICARYPLSAFHAAYGLNGGYLDPLADGTAYIDETQAPESDKYVRTLALTHPEWTRPLRARLNEAEALWRALPPVALLSHVGTYVWGLMLLLFLIRRTKQKRLAWLLLPSLMTLAACLLSSGFGSGGRYAFPIAYTLPYLACMLLGGRITASSSNTGLLR